VGIYIKYEGRLIMAEKIQETIDKLLISQKIRYFESTRMIPSSFERGINLPPSHESRYYKFIPDSGWEEEISLNERDFEKLLGSALENGVGAVETKRTVILDSETDGSMEVYYLQYQRYLEQKTDLRVMLTLKDKPRFDVEVLNVREEWSNWQ